LADCCDRKYQWTEDNQRRSICGAEMKMKAVIDRFEGDKAVLLVGEEEDNLIVPRTSLPSGAREGQWLQVDVEDDRVLTATIDEDETARAKERIAEKLGRLRG
jgi:hypothetical protein